MDLIDVIKATLRWSVLVAIIIALGVWQAQELALQVDLSYEVQSKALLLGPSTIVEKNDDGSSTETAINPLGTFSSSLSITTSAIVEHVGSDAYRQLVADEGLRAPMPSVVCVAPPQS